DEVKRPFGPPPARRPALPYARAKTRVPWGGRGFPKRAPPYRHASVTFGKLKRARVHAQAKSSGPSGRRRHGGRRYGRAGYGSALLIRPDTPRTRTLANPPDPLAPGCRGRSVPLARR